MPVKPENVLPEVGDIVKYTRDHPYNTVTLPVTRTHEVSPSAGYSSYWLSDGIISEPLFNIDWSTLTANRGSWELVSKKTADEAKPREFMLPEQPADLKRVSPKDDENIVYVYNPDREVWTFEDADQYGYSYDWSELLNDYPDGLIELLETPYEKAVAYFKDNSFNASRTDALDHAKVIIAKAIEEA